MGRRHFGTFAALTLIVAIPLQVLVGVPFAHALERANLHPESGPAQASVAGHAFVFIFIWFLAITAEVAAVGHAGARAWLHMAGSTREEAAAWARVAPRVLAALTLEVLLGHGALIGGIILAWFNAGGVALAVMVGLPLSFWLGTAFLFAPIEAAFGCSPARALGQSWRLVRRSFWKVVGTWLAVQSICAFTLLLPATLLYQVHPASGAGLALWLVFFGVLLEVLCAPFRAGLVAALWIDLRCRREGLDLEMRLSSPEEALGR